MNSYLENELRILAQEILDTETDDVLVWQEKSRLLYERLTVLAYNTSVVSEKEISSIEEEPSTPLSVRRETNEENDNVSSVIEATEIIEEVPEENIAPSLPVSAPSQEEVTEETVEEKKKTKRHSSKTEDIFQQSLFDQDLFSTEIIGFDPDDDIFEKAPSISSTGKDSISSLSTSEPIEETTQIEAITEETQESTEDVATEQEDSTPEPTKETPQEKKSFFSFRILDTDEDDDDSDTEENISTTPQDKSEESPVPELIETLEKDLPTSPIEESAPIIESITGEIVEETPESTDNDTGTPQDDDSAVVVEDVIKDEFTASPDSSETPEMTINEALGQNNASQKMSVNDMLASKNIAISLNDRIAFINNLFDGEVEDFENTIRYVFSQKEVDVVIEYITEIIKPYYNNWIEKEEYEKRFMNIILKYFS